VQFAGQDHSISPDTRTDTDTILVGNNLLASRAAKERAQQLGFAAEIVTSTLQGEAREVGKRLAMHLKTAKRRVGGEKHCWIYGGETTVTIQGKGRGGRNQELALAAALELQGCQNVCLLSIATDGEDGPTDAAGAIVDENTVDNGVKKGLDARQYLARNDAYAYFEKIGGLIKTGPSGTNVNDLIFLFSL
jgi:glycerate 2-kinase